MLSVIVPSVFILGVIMQSVEELIYGSKTNGTGINKISNLGKSDNHSQGN